MITPSMNDLFGQLGLENDERHIDNFIERHRPIPAKTHIEDASFWSPSQASFLQHAREEDAEWAEVIDQLDTRLR